MGKITRAKRVMDQTIQHFDKLEGIKPDVLANELFPQGSVVVVQERNNKSEVVLGIVESFGYTRGDSGWMLTLKSYWSLNGKVSRNCLVNDANYLDIVAVRHAKWNEVKSLLEIMYMHIHNLKETTPVNENLLSLLGHSYLNQECMEANFPDQCIQYGFYPKNQKSDEGKEPPINLVEEDIQTDNLEDENKEIIDDKFINYLESLSTSKLISLENYISLKVKERYINELKSLSKEIDNIYKKLNDNGQA